MTSTVLRPLSPSDDPVVQTMRVLRQAASAGDEAGVRAALQDLPRPLPRRTNDDPVLITAVAGNHPGVLQALIQHGENLDERSTLGWTALMEAAAQGQQRALTTLLNAGARALLHDPRLLQNALHLAADGNQIGTAVLLLNIPTAPALLQQHDRMGRRPYDLARENGFERMADLLAEAQVALEQATLNTALDSLRPGTHDPHDSHDPDDRSGEGTGTTRTRARL